MHSKDNKLGLYIHIPFCKAKCHYCDFNSYASVESLIPGYFEALKKEIRLYSSILKDYSIKTVFIGGGTPSFVDTHHIYETINSIGRSLNLEDNAETTIETNPGTLTYEKLLAYRSMGINRLSMGLQAWQDRLLRYLGRIHTSEEFAENFKLARKAGFTNINVDLIFGIPGQTIGDWIETLLNVTALDITHLSCYSLMIEEGTPFGDWFKKGQLVPVDDELDREMYWETVHNLEKQGFHHYEISNFARPGFECRHNLIYWNVGQYIGIGAGAHSYFEGRRFSNPVDVNRYISVLKENMLPSEGFQEIDKYEEMSEYIILGFRLVDGISIEGFKERFNSELMNVYGDKIKKLANSGLVESDETRIRLTPLGLDLANQVFVEFV